MNPDDIKKAWINKANAKWFKNDATFSQRILNGLDRLPSYLFQKPPPFNILDRDSATPNYPKNIWEVGEVVSVTFNKLDYFNTLFRVLIVDKKSDNVFVLCGLGECTKHRYTYSTIHGLRLIE